MKQPTMLLEWGVIFEVLQLLADVALLLPDRRQLTLIEGKIK